MNKIALMGIFWVLPHVAVAAGASGPTVELDHVWIMVSQDAPERAALEGAGFRSRLIY
jgi:hypothetical protein